MSETEAPADATSKSRGRPRPEATIERDEKVLVHLKGAGAQTRKQIVEATGIEGNEVYLSLYRLKRDNKITKAGGSWSAVADEVAASAE